nr:hypothetical protein [Tanacetum cinerariifolium]
QHLWSPPENFFGEPQKDSSSPDLLDPSPHSPLCSAVPTPLQPPSALPTAATTSPPLLKPPQPPSRQPLYHSHFPVTVSTSRHATSIIPNPKRPPPQSHHHHTSNTTAYTTNATSRHPLPRLPHSNRRCPVASRTKRSVWIFISCRGVCLWVLAATGYVRLSNNSKGVFVSGYINS